MHRTVTRLLLATTLASGLPLVSAAHAEEGASSEINDIVVTARRRAEPLQRTPVSVSALSAADIESRVAVNIVDLGKSMPNVRIDALGSQGRAGMLAIRGVNYARSDQAGDPSTAFYIDGLYQTRSTINILDMFDLESIEVLRGPQGTMFGRNAFAGAVNIRSKRPTMEFGGQAEAKVANFGRMEFRGAVNVPIVNDVLAVRASVLVANSDGYYRSIRDNGRRIGGDDNITGRVSVLYTPSPAWNIFLKYEHVRDRGDPTPAQNASTTADMAAATPGLPAQVFGTIAGDPPNAFAYPKYWTNVNVAEGMKSFVDQDNVALNVNYDIEGGSISSITGYQHASDGLITDPVGGSIAYLTNYYRTKLSTFSQELRLLKELNDNFQILLGAYYAKDDLKSGNITYSEYSGAFNSQTNVKQKRDSWAVFAELEVRPVERVRLNASGRQMWEDKTFSFSRQSRNPATVPAAVDLAGGTFLPLATPYVVRQKKWNNFSPKISVDWRPLDDVMLYASWTKGFKSGGYPAITSVVPTAYDPEKIETWEAGIKSFLFDRKLRANLTLFWNNLSDLQRSVNFTDPDTGAASNNVFNAANAVTKGVEVEFEARPTDQLRIRWSGGYLKANYKDFCASGFSPTPILGQAAFLPCGTTPGNVDYSGLPLYNAPKWQGAVGGSYDVDLGNKGNLTFNADLNYTSSLYTNDTPWPISRRGAMTLVDASVQWRSADERYYVSIYAQNIFDEIDTQQAIRSGGTLTVFNYTPPRRYGVVFGTKF